jgi:hypothetical protein
MAASPRQRVKLEANTVCFLCNNELFAGMTAFVMGDPLAGFKHRHYGKCPGQLREERNARRADYTRKTADELIALLEVGSQSERMDAAYEIKRRIGVLDALANPALVENMKAIVNYMIFDEEEHWDAVGKPERHIYHDVLALDKFVKSRVEEA